MRRHAHMRAPQAARQFLLLSHLYSRTDSASLAAIRRQLLPPWATPAQVRVPVKAVCESFKAVCESFKAVCEFFKAALGSACLCVNL